MSIIDRKDIQAAYKKEAVSLINKIGKGLFSFNEQRIFRLFRYAHTLKGISGTCGYYKIEAAAKSIEEVFRAAKNGKLGISSKDEILVRKKLKECEELLMSS